MEKHYDIEVVHIAETIRGGIATYLKHIIPLQIKRYGKRKIAVIIPDSQVSDLSGCDDAQIITFPASSNRLYSAWRARKYLEKYINNSHVHVIHIHSTFAGLSCRILPLNNKNHCGIIYCPHGWAFLRYSNYSSLAKNIEKYLSRRTDAIVCVSNAERDAAAIAGIQEKKLHIVRNGLPDISGNALIRTRGGISGELNAIFIGRLDRQKGFDVLLAAIEEVKRPLVIHVFGDSVLKDSFFKYIPKQVLLHGWQSSEVINKYLCLSDVVVMPSRWEGLPMAAIEAMRAGKAIIGSSIGGLIEIIEDGVTGKLVPVDDPKALADVLDSITIPELTEMGKKNRQQFIADFQINKVEEELAKIYEIV